jgi:hypothetical protein
MIFHGSCVTKKPAQRTLVNFANGTGATHDRIVRQGRKSKLDRSGSILKLSDAMIVAQ